MDAETGMALVTDVCLKRKVRNYVQIAKGLVKVTIFLSNPKKEEVFINLIDNVQRRFRIELKIKEKDKIRVQLVVCYVQTLL